MVRCPFSKWEFILRLEDLDPERALSEFSDNMVDDLKWLGLDWDELNLQSDNTDQHYTALDKLALSGALSVLHEPRRNQKDRYTVTGWWICLPQYQSRMPFTSRRLETIREPLRAQLPDKTFEPNELSRGNWSQTQAAYLVTPLSNAEMALSLTILRSSSTMQVLRYPMLFVVLTSPAVPPPRWHSWNYWKFQAQSIGITFFYWNPEARNSQNYMVP